ncbi:MAG: helix-turn-helix transcriptional regulator [Clostridia bacterium]|nr:helix-turn-helix transcriptional regulator [Clostridia bacterium]
MIAYKDFFIGHIYTVVKKTEDIDFSFENMARDWDGFVLLTEGEGKFVDEQGNVENFMPGDIVLLRRGYHYQIRLPYGGSYITSALDIYFKGLEEKSLFPRILHLDEETIECFEKATAVFSTHEEGSVVQSRILLTSLYVKMLQSIEPRSNLINKEAKAAERIVRRTFRENLSVTEIANQCSISPSYLRACFLRAYGMSLTKYREQLRIEEAEILIRCGFFKLSEIAEQLGYCDVFHFTKNFTRAKGISPAKYREKYQKEL